MNGSKMRSILAVMGCTLTAVTSVTADKEPRRNLSSYPLQDRVWVGNFGGKVEVNPMVDLETKRFGRVEWKAQDDEEVEAGQTVAWQAADHVRHSQNQLDMLKEEHLLKMEATEWEHQEKINANRRSLRELESKLRSLELTPQERRIVGEEFVARLDERKSEIEAELDAARMRLDPERLATELKLERQRLIADLDKAQLDHADLVNNMSLIAPHDGVLRHLEQGDVDKGAIVGRIERQGRAVASLKIVDPEVRSEKPERLAIIVTGPSGQRVQGSFSHVEKMLDVGLGSVIHHFELEPREGQSLDNEMSGERMISVYRLLGRQARVVPKSAFLFEEPAKIQNMGWAAYIKEIWPQSEIVYIGPTAIAVAEKP
ncbi:MAG: hypothetical protein R3242_07005 [Akkermansiaceae bacterium]|nr:hypothetical protein [Akkermansiaceae bacterium]